jgi:hypothetical protein
MAEFDKHAAKELALCLINENTTQFSYDNRVAAGRIGSPSVWQSMMQRYAKQYQGEWEITEPFSASTILAAAAEVAEYYERHIAEIDAA